LWNSVASPCFIFHIDTVQRGTFTCKGMGRCFYIRYSKTRNGKLLPISESGWNSFYRDEEFPDVESFPEVLWSNILLVKREVQKAMCRGGQWDGRTVSTTPFSQPSFLRYLKDEIEDAFGEEISKAPLRCTRSKMVIHDNLSVSRRKMKFHGELNRILSEDKLDAVRKVLGVTFAVGVTQLIPSLKQLRNNPSLSGTVWLKNYDPVRIVTCYHKGEDLVIGSAKPLYRNSHTHLVNRPMELLCSYRGLNFKFNTVRNGISELTIHCRFLKMRGDSKPVQKVFGMNETIS
jgi:hypothetical protein